MASKEYNIPKSEYEKLAWTFLPDIIAFYESEEGQKEYKEWLEQKKKNE
jgi:hypothetical protein